MRETKKTDYELTIDFNSIDTLIVMDSNVWLNLYTIHPLALMEIIGKFRENKEVFWIPNQVYKEYAKNAKSKKEYVLGYYKMSREKCIKEISRARDIVNQEFENFKRKQRTDGEELQAELLDDYEKIIQKVKKGYKELEKVYTDELKVICEEDLINKLVDEIYENSKDEDFSIMEKVKICEEGEIRYKYKIAPGYTDADKKDIDYAKGDFYRKYGDLIIWKELLRKVKGTKINTLFIEDEKKKDWFSEKGGKKLAPVLYEEYNQATNNQGKIQVCDFLSFLENYGDAMGLLESQISDLIEKLKFEKNTLKYVDDNKESIVHDYIMDHFDDLGNAYEIFYDSGYSVFGGVFESIDDLSISYIKLAPGIKLSYDRTLDIFCIDAEFTVWINAEISEYVNRGVLHIGNIDFCIEGAITLDMAINFENTTKSADRGFEIVDANFIDEAVQEIESGEYEIFVDLEED